MKLGYFYLFIGLHRHGFYVAPVATHFDLIDERRHKHQNPWPENDLPTPNHEDEENQTRRVRQKSD